MSADERDELLRAARGGLCSSCAHARLVRSARGSSFVRCVHPDLPKYLPQPVLRCPGYAAAPPSD